MEDKQNKYGIVLDGRLDEAIWDTTAEYTGFTELGCHGGKLVKDQTFFRVLTFEDRIYIGIKCYEPAGMDVFHETRTHTCVPGVEVFLSPSGSYFEYYQFILTSNGKMDTRYYSEAGNIQPDQYYPEWSSAVYYGDTYWSAEFEIPLKAFYWTEQNRWSTNWLLNVCRSHFIGGLLYTSWTPMQFEFHESKKFRTFEDFPMRPERDDLRIISALAELTEETPDGYKGTLTVKTANAFTDTFEFVSDYADSVTITLNAGNNEFTVPCCYKNLGRNHTLLSLVRTEDGSVFKRYYPVVTQYEPIKLKLTQPEYRCNFYPGQDFSQIVGTVYSCKPMKLKLEGPGIETTVIEPNDDGSFRFDTSNFQIGDAYLTVTIDGYERKQKIRRLAPSDKMMTWISGGNLIVNGRPTLRRDMYARAWHSGTASNRKYYADNLHETWLDYISLEPRDLDPLSERAGGEAYFDQMPSDELLRKVDAVIERNKDRDFAYYYISDEPECRGLSMIYFENYYRYIAEKDPYHVILSATRSADAGVNMADWFETHPYMVPYVNEDGSRTYMRPLHTMGKYVDDIALLNRSDKCIGFLPTCFSIGFGALASSGWDYPTFDEYITHIWAGMMHGGKSLWPYAGHDLPDRGSLYEGTRYVFSSFEALEDIVLHGKRTTLMQTIDVEAVLYEYEDQKMFVIVNLTQQPQTVTLDGISGTWHEFRHDRLVTGNTFELKPLKTMVCTNVVKDAGLPTYQQTEALIDQIEYERTHTGSLLFGHALEIGITCSDSLYGWNEIKYFDGVRDVVAYCVRGNDEGFIELNLDKVKPTFNKVVVHGYLLDNLKLMVRNNGELSVPAIADRKLEEFSVTFDLCDYITPDCLRFEWDQSDAMEFCEFEVY